jgi:hypothetical protein
MARARRATLARETPAYGPSSTINRTGIFDIPSGFVTAYPPYAQASGV